MEKGKGVKWKTGAFTIAGLGIALLLIFFIGSQQNLFSSTSNLYVNYRSVAGLKEGAFVRFNGINVGTVDLISIINDSTVKVDISVKKKVMPFVKEGSRASISSDGLMGDKLIQIIPASQDAPPVKDNAELVAVNPIDMDRLMSKVEKAGARIESILENVDSLSGNLASLVGGVRNGPFGKMLNNEKLGNDLKQTIAEAKTTVKSAGKAAENVTETLEAAKHNFLLRGYFKKKERKRIKDSIAKAKALQKNIGKDDKEKDE